MLPDDITNIEALLHANPISPNSILVFSAETGDEQLMVERLYPSATIDTMSQQEWDLDHELVSEQRWDLGIIMNTMMCSTDPSRWLENIAKHVGQLAIQDNATSHRCHDRFCAVHDGDVARYSVGSHSIIGQTDPELRVYDLSTSGHRVVDARPYLGGVKFVALLQLSR